MTKTIYFVLTNTGTLLSKAIGMYTKEDLNHVSIAFDEQLTEMYSFGRKQRHNPFLGGFVKEHADKGIFKEADCAIYRLIVTNEEYESMRNKIREIEQSQEDYKYNFIGIFAIAVNKEFDRKNAFFCSEFVATVVNESGLSLFDAPPSLVQPGHFTKLPRLQSVYGGNLQQYLQDVRKTAYQVHLEPNIWQHVRARMFA